MKKRYNIVININKTTLTSPDYTLPGSAIEIKEDGVVLGESSNHWRLCNADREAIGLVVNNNSVDLTNKKIYRYPKLTLPRNKVNLLKDKFNLKLVRDPDKADYHIVSTKLINTLVSFSWNNHYTFNNIFNFFRQLKQDGVLSQSGLTKAQDIINHADRDGMFTFPNSYNYYDDPNGRRTYDKFQDARSALSKVSSEDSFEGYKKAIYISGSDQDKLDDYNSIAANTNKLVWDTDILDIIDEDLAVIDNKQYDTIEQMLTTSDRESRTLAVEMLANCNINKSFDVVSGLFYWNYDFFKDSNYWNSVNVKSLREQMKDYSGGVSENNIYAYNTYLEKLANQGKLTKFAVDRTRDRLANNVMKMYVNGKNAFTLDKSQLILNPELTSQIIDE